MQRTRECTPQRFYGMGLLMVVVSMIWTLWAIFVFLIWVPKLDEYPILARVVLALFNLTYANLLIAFYMSVMTDPGLVPRSWGFYMATRRSAVATARCVTYGSQTERIIAPFATDAY
jgi:hypothetical protein